jgi:hypothetical protein
MAEKIQKELEEESHQTDEWLKHGKNKAWSISYSFIDKLLSEPVLEHCRSLTECAIFIIKDEDDLYE